MNKKLISVLLCSSLCIVSVSARRKPKLDYSDNALTLGLTAPIGYVNDGLGISGHSLSAGTGLSFDSRTLSDNYNLGFYFSTGLFVPRTVYALSADGTAYSMSDYDGITGFDFLLGGYHLYYHQNNINVPFALGMHMGLLYDKLSVGLVTKRANRMAFGIGAATGIEYKISKYFGVSFLVKLYYDCYAINQIRTATLKTTTTNTSSGTTSDVWIDPTIGFVIHYGE